jgi:hypothetical protein
MKIEVKRISKKPTYTIGKMYINDLFIADTLEDVVRPDGVKVFGETAIPAGTYNVKLTYSNRFKKTLPLIENVPMFEGIRIHAGNTDADTHGCILVGTNDVVGRITNSQFAMRKIMTLLGAAINPITIKIG